jgi:hypothetical protein
MAQMLSNWIGPLLELELRNAMNLKIKRDGCMIESLGLGKINSSQYSIDYQCDKSSLRANVNFSTDQSGHAQVREVKPYLAHGEIPLLT